MRNWVRITVLPSEAPEDWGAWINALDQAGITSTEQRDHPPALIGYASEQQALEWDSLRRDLGVIGSCEITTELVPEQDWAEAWKQYFRVRRIGKHWLIKPSWEEVQPQPGDLLIELDPGQAFGTGDHPTTRLCLELMEDIDLKGKRVLDLGCGSGILSVAALKIGAKEVVATDIDPVAVEATMDNARRNGCSLQAIVSDGFADVTTTEPFEVVVSNIISATLINVAPQVRLNLISGGIWLLSGVIEDNWCSVLEAAERSRFRLLEHRKEGQWVAAVLQA